MPLGGVMRCIGPPMFGCPETMYNQWHTDFWFLIFFLRCWYFKFRSSLIILNVTDVKRLLDFLHNILLQAVTFVYVRCLCRPCCLVGSIPLGNIGWLPGTPPSPYREKRTQHLHHSTLSHIGAGQFYKPRFCQMPVGVSMDLTWLGNLSGGLGPPGYRGDMNGWKKTNGNISYYLHYLIIQYVD